jgi:hypothetical protein
MADSRLSRQERTSEQSERLEAEKISQGVPAEFPRLFGRLAGVSPSRAD